MIRSWLDKRRKHYDFDYEVLISLPKYPAYHRLDELAADLGALPSEVLDAFRRLRVRGFQIVSGTIDENGVVGWVEADGWRRAGVKGREYWDRSRRPGRS